MTKEFESEGNQFRSTSGLQRIKPEQGQAGVRTADVEAKTKANYIMSFGFPGSGKTTFQWFLMQFLMNSGSYRSEIHVPRTVNGSDWEGRRIINDWKEQWIEGRFPEPTQAAESDIREITVSAAPTTGKDVKLEFSFLEVSGELLALAMPEIGRAPHLTPLLRAYFENCAKHPNFKIALMLLLHPDVEENDKLFASFMQYLDHEIPGLRSKMSLGIIVSKPEASLARLREYGAADGRMYYERFDADALEDYLVRFCTETYTVWDSWPDASKTLLSPLYLGEIQEREGEPRLVKPDFDHTEEIFLWLFEQFIGERPGPTRWQKMREALKWE